jgi:hypothetical protein
VEYDNAAGARPGKEKPAATPDDGLPNQSVTRPPSSRTNYGDHTAYRLTSSQQVNWWAVHEFTEHVKGALGVQVWPTVGTPAWCALPDDDPVKWAAVADAAQHWALRVEESQRAECQASHAISAAADWSAIAIDVQERETFAADHPWSRRAAS